MAQTSKDKCHFHFNYLPLDYWQINYKTSSTGREWGKEKYGNEVIFIRLSFPITSVGTATKLNLSFTAIKVQIGYQILVKLRTHSVCYEDPENKTE